MLASAEAFISTLEAKQIKFNHYPPQGERTIEAVIIDYAGKHGNNLSFAFFFDQNGNTVNVKIFSICKVNEEKLMNMYVTLNEINYEYRWIKVYMDSENEVTASGDAIVNPETAGEECFEILLRYLSILDDVYPRIMKALWS